MNRYIFYCAFIFAIHAGCISNSSDYSNNDVENKISTDEINWVVRFFLSLFEDPEFLALSVDEQISVINMIYSILQSSYNRRKRWIYQLKF